MTAGGHQKKIVFFDDGVYDKCKRAATSRMKTERRSEGPGGKRCTMYQDGTKVCGYYECKKCETGFCLWN